MTTQHARFLEWLQQQTGNQCWAWGESHNVYGYGRVYLGLFDKKQRYAMAHRLAYETLRGPIPDGLELDHLCRNPPCCNPAHLEIVTSAENTRRGESPSAKNARKTHCPRGHEYTPENTYAFRLRAGTWGRNCRSCERERWKRNNAKKKLARSLSHAARSP